MVLKCWHANSPYFREPFLAVFLVSILSTTFPFEFTIWQMSHRGTSQMAKYLSVLWQIGIQDFTSGRPSSQDLKIDCITSLWSKLDPFKLATLNTKLCRFWRLQKLQSTRPLSCSFGLGSCCVSSVSLGRCKSPWGRFVASGGWLALPFFLSQTGIKCEWSRVFPVSFVSSHLHMSHVFILWNSISSSLLSLILEYSDLIMFVRCFTWALWEIISFMVSPTQFSPMRISLLKGSVFNFFILGESLGWTSNNGTVICKDINGDINSVWSPVISDTVGLL